ncbi:MAG: purine-binding chemotaxis protein CheW [Rhodospirillaceae bacterium]|nr:purine-binding chemotaxis protein CheW [Rhodospirillales bacterium]
MPATSDGQSATRQFISFTIGAEEYGVEIIAIREIKGWSPTTALPDTPSYMRGVMDLRGAIIPIIDLRARFGGGLTTISSRHVIMVVAVGGREIGILVDAVADIITVADNAIQPIPELEHAHHAELLAGIVAVDGRMVALLDLARLFETHSAAA